MTSTDRAWRDARRTRDRRFDGRFFIGVVTTGIYCRPICPAPQPREENVRYFPTAAAAAEAGFRPCLRCRPETAPHSPAWLGTPATVQRALRLIEEHGLDDLTIDDLAARLGIGPRHLRRLFVAHLGASPLAVLQTYRLHFAKQLIDTTRLPFSAIALSSGFGSIRRFNAVIRRTWQRTPTMLRTRTAEHDPGRSGYSFRVAYRPPFDWAALLAFLERRAIAGMEEVSNGRYVRAFEMNGAPGLVNLGDRPDAHTLDVHLHWDQAPALYRVIARVRALCDLDADPLAIAFALSGDPLLRRIVERRPGLRVPGAWDGFEILVRAIVGQQTSVAGARTLLGRLVGRYGRAVEIEGRTWRLFPTPAALRDAALDDVGLTRRRALAIRTAARAAEAGDLPLGRDGDPMRARRALAAIPGVGDWTIEYVAMRALGDPDAFPAGDLVIRQATGLSARPLRDRADRWRPWRAYAALYLWMGASDDHRSLPHARREPRRPAAARRGSARPASTAVRARTAG